MAKTKIINFTVLFFFNLRTYVIDIVKVNLFGWLLLVIKCKNNITKSYFFNFNNTHIPILPIVYEYLPTT